MKVASRDLVLVLVVALIVAATTFRLSYEIDGQFSRLRVDAEMIASRRDSIYNYQQDEIHRLSAESAGRDSVIAARQRGIVRRQREIIARVARLQREQDGQ